MKPLRIIVADDHPLFRNGITTLLKATPDMEVVSEAATGEEVVEQAATLQPDVILMDLQMPDGGGIKATQRILQHNPLVRILIVTMFEEDASVFAALRVGARGYVLKDADEEEIIRAIRAVGNGEAIFSPAIAQRFLGFFASAQRLAAPSSFPDLTEREREILHLIASGYNNAEIARRLVLSLKTVANYVSSILAKLQVTDRSQAIVRAREAGFGSE